MLRIIFVLVIGCTGIYFALQSAFYSLLFYLWIAYFRPEQWVWVVDFFSSLNLSLFAGTWTVLYTVFSRARWAFNGRIALLGLFFLHTLTSAMLADHNPDAVEYWMVFAKALVLTYLLPVLITDVKKFRLAFFVIAWSLAFESAKQGWVQLVLSPGVPNANTLPMLGDNNGLAVGMLMLLPMLTTLAATATLWWEKPIHRFVAIGVLYRGLSTYSRGGFLACGAVGLTYILRSTKRAAAITGIVVGMAVILPALPSAFWDRMATISAPDEDPGAEGAEAEDQSILGRLHFWHVAVIMADEHPFFGVGHNSYNSNYDYYDDANGLFGHRRSVHSQWFGLLAELGYPGLLMFVALLLLAFRSCIKARKAARANPQFADLAKFAFSLEASFVAMIVGGSFVPFQYNEMLWHFIGLSITLDLLAETALARVEAPAGIHESASVQPGVPRPALAS